MGPTATVIFLAVVLTILSIHGGHSNPADPNMQGWCTNAVSVVNMGPAGSQVTGIVEFQEDVQTNLVSVKGAIHGFPPNTQHGFHIHESGDLRNPTNPCLSAGPHFNPFMNTHGGPQDSVRHIGDLGNIVAGPDGVARIDFKDTHIKLNGPLSIIGRAVVVHEKEDDLGRDGADSKNTGNAGARVACGVVGIIQKKPQ